MLFTDMLTRQLPIQVKPDLGELTVTLTTNQMVDAPISSNYILPADSGRIALR